MQSVWYAIDRPEIMNFQTGDAASSHESHMGGYPIHVTSEPMLRKAPKPLLDDASDSARPVPRRHVGYQQLSYVFFALVIPISALVRAIAAGATMLLFDIVRTRYVYSSGCASSVRVFPVLLQRLNLAVRLALAFAHQR